MRFSGRIDLRGEDTVPDSERRVAGQPVGLLKQNSFLKGAALSPALPVGVKANATGCLAGG
jgi:hypothetical protein